MKRLAILLAVFLLASCANMGRPTAPSDTTGSAGAMSGAGAAGTGVEAQPGTYGLSGP